ncbi:zinc finger protein Pegasus-like isoform X2 [Acanthaster planci]|uniref:Zinc finger protein Pegasus-like isoform X2 n=1 Tax=Acanthaster planci TaxID=133434 RepID=A0A8B7ZI57_ACAPL|nr:zinc finger protein Pegasus-like isoform X2 [Acanthaster planci]
MTTMMFKCSWPNCSFTAKRRALLKNHLRNHSQEKPFKCRYCSYSTESRSNCNVHEQRMHTFQRPHKCHYCAYSCVQSTTLRQHVQIKHKERCQYRCFQCRSFYCQRESQLMYHLLKVHQTTTISEISPYLNPTYLPDYLPAMAEFACRQTGDQGLAISNASTQQQPTEPLLNQPQQSRRYAAAQQKAVLQISPTPCKLIRSTTNSFPTIGSSVVTPTVVASTFQPIQAGRRNSSGASQYQRPHPQTTRQASLNDLSEHSLLASSSLITPLDGGPEVIEIIENDDESGLTEEKPDGQSNNGLYCCSHCLLTFTDENGLINHVLTIHPETTSLEQRETTEEGIHQQGITHQDSITSSSSFVVTYPTNQSAMTEASPVSVPISHSDFAVPPVVKQEESPGSQLCPEVWPSVSHIDDRVPSDTRRQERLSSETISESAFANVQIQRSASRSSQDGSLGQPVSAREGTPLLSMPSPTTTHSNRVTVSTQTVPSSAERGEANPSKFRCVHCNIVFPDNVLFTIHRGAHGFRSPFECNFCGKDCGNKHEFASHLHNCS